MTDTQPPSSSAKKTGWSRKFAWLAGGLFVLLLIAYFVVTSSGFLKAVVLPRVSRILNAQVTADQISLSPFSKIGLRQLKVQAAGQEPALQADEVLARYSLWGFLRGDINIQEIYLVRPSLQWLENAGGSNNLTPILNALTTPAAAATPPTAETKGNKIRLDKLSLQQGSVRWTKETAQGQRLSAEIADLNISLSQFGNEQTGKLDISGLVKATQRAASNAPTDQLEARLSGATQFKFDANLKPQSIDGQQRLQVTRAEGAWSNLNQFATQLDCQLTPTEVRLLSCQFERNQEKLGQIRLAGPMDFAKNEGRLRLEIRSLDQRILNLARSVTGCDFGNSQLNSTNVIDFAEKGGLIAANGSLQGSRLSLRRLDQRTPEMDLDCDYQFSLNTQEQTLLLQRFLFRLKQNKSDFVNLSLERPANLAWGDKRIGFKESALQLVVTNLQLADWRPFVGPAGPAGLLNLSLRSTIQQDGRQLALDLQGNITGLEVKASNRVLTLPQFQIRAKGRFDDLFLGTLDTLRFEAGDWFRGDASGNLDCRTGNFTSRLNILASIPLSLQHWPLPGIAATSGECKATVLLTSKPGARGETAAQGSLAVTDLDARCGDLAFNRYQLNLDYDVLLRDQQLEIKRFNLAPRLGFDRGGSFDFSGKCNLTNMNSEFKLTLIDLNHNAIAPLRAAIPALQALKTFALNASANIAFQPPGSLTARGDLMLTNLVIANVAQKSANTPVGLTAQLDAGMRDKVLDLRQCRLAFGPTTNALTNELTLRGRVDASRSNAIAGQLFLQSDTLDLTAWYRAFSGLTGATNLAANTNATGAQTPVATATAKSEIEPEAIRLPLNPFTLEAKMNRIFLGDMAITNLQAGLKIADNQVQVDPLQLLLNGAPAKGAVKVNLGVPGHIYDVNFQVDKAPIEPMANTFLADARGQYKGDLSLQIQVKGAGTTGVNLKNNLTGQTSLLVTNTTVSLMEPNVSRLLGKIPLVGKIISSLTGPTISFLAGKLGIEELKNSALSGLDIFIALGNGQIDIQRLGIASPAFQLDSPGHIPMADVLNNSPMNQPVAISLRKALAQKIKVADNNETREYVALPALVKVTGTIGQPKQEYDYLKLGQLGLRVASGFLGNSDTGNTLKQIGNLTGGLGGNTNSAASTNTSGKLGDNLGGLVENLLGNTNKTATGTLTNQDNTNTNTSGGKNDALIKEGLNLLPGLFNSTRSNTNK